MTGQPAGPRVRLLRRVVVTSTSEGLDAERLRAATNDVRAGDDVVLVVRGRLGFEPSAASFLGRLLVEARTISVEAGGPGASQFVGDLERAAATEAAVYG